LAINNNPSNVSRYFFGKTMQMPADWFFYFSMRKIRIYFHEFTRSTKHPNIIKII
jgi:hypothetical protein